MTGTSHIIFGTATGVIASFLSPSLSLFHLPLISFSSLLPDIDSSSSKIGKKVKWVGKVFGHRGFFHTPFFLSLFFLIPNEGIKLSFVIGIASHLFLDLMNRGGVRLFWPISEKKFRIANLKCGTWGESAIVLLLIGIEILFMQLQLR